MLLSPTRPASASSPKPQIKWNSCKKHLRGKGLLRTHTRPGHRLGRKPPGEKRPGPRLGIRADLYGILEVPDTATGAEIRTAYRRLVKQLHPDVNRSPGAAAALQAVNDAYTVLSNDALRKKYCDVGYSFLGPQYAKYAAYGSGGKRKKDAVAGKDVRTLVWLDMVEAALGIERVVKVKVARKCPTCFGSSSHAPSGNSCLACRGSGEVMRQSNVERGTMGFLGACPVCGGNGARSQQWCKDCGGGGLAKVPRLFRVRVPPGVDQDSVLRLKGCGDEGRHGGKPGDIFVSFVVKPRPDIKRRGLDLVSTVNVAYTDAILGGTYEVPTLHGTTNLDIPPGTQHGDNLVLAGQGVAPLKSSADTRLRETGSHIYEVVMRVPLQVSPAERSILERLRLTRGRDVGPWDA